MSLSINNADDSLSSNSAILNLYEIMVTIELIFRSIFDSLKDHIKFRVSDAMKIPPGLGREFEERPLHKEVNYTPGDIHNIQGKRIYIKPSDE